MLELALTIIIQVIGLAFSYGILYQKIKNLETLIPKVSLLETKVSTIDSYASSNKEKIDRVFNWWVDRNSTRSKAAHGD